MMRKIIWIFLALAGLLLSCDEDSNPIDSVEATDEEAIFNVIMLDHPRLSVLDILSTDIPDTLTFTETPDAANPLYWHVVDTTYESITITISNTQVDSPVGLVYQSYAHYTETYEGTFEILAYNSSADSLERYSKEFSLAGSRNVYCQKWGTSSQRRGWVLTSISGASFTAGGGYNFPDDLYYHCQSNDDSAFVISTQETDDIVRFDAEEQLTLTYNDISSTDLVYIFVPDENYSYILATPELVDGSYQVQITMPSVSRLWGQLRFLVINAGQYSQNYKATGHSYNYRIR